MERCQWLGDNTCNHSPIPLTSVSDETGGNDKGQLGASPAYPLSTGTGPGRVCTDGPTLDGIDPSLDGNDPSLDGIDPSLDGNDPSLDGNDPSLDGNDPSLDGIDPSLDGIDPSVPSPPFVR
ncbi:unnamed protein product [Cyprideis torosa]|uniref:Uncharacterized protein n=1 Tax=Cyprideis torosa TaxID=163714 RepID=A0A7R8WIM1_9CRUS|nr:unnamed protein product [Cyprideis torosa]CAG0900861.1 unnamed protein product [Cyprideis torosa]